MQARTSFSDRIAKVLETRSEYLSASMFGRHRKLACEVLENEDAFDRTVREIDGAPAIVKCYGPVMDSFA